VIPGEERLPEEIKEGITAQPALLTVAIFIIAIIIIVVFWGYKTGKIKKR